MRKCCGHILFLSFLAGLLSALPAYAEDRKWYLLSREEGCVDLDMLVSKEKLPRTPASPEDFAQMMRESGHQVSVGPLPDTPAEFVGKVVEVKMDNGRAPVFVREEVCRMVERNQ